MINPNELRIGNLVNWDADHMCGGTCKVVVINEFRFEVGSLAGCYPLQEDYTDIAPIPLTPEWLERCGFEWNEIIHRWEHSVSGYCVGRDDFGFSNGIGDGTFAQPYIKHVHQLQNLYWCLVGEELVIKNT